MTRLTSIPPHIILKLPLSTTNFIKENNLLTNFPESQTWSQSVIQMDFWDIFSPLGIKCLFQTVFVSCRYWPDGNYKKGFVPLLRSGSFQEFRDIGQNLFFCYKSFISCGKSESKKLISYSLLEILLTNAA